MPWSQLKGVKSVNAVTGPYDIIAIVEGETLNEIGDLVTSKIHPIAGISRTVTCLSNFLKSDCNINKSILRGVINYGLQVYRRARISSRQEVADFLKDEISKGLWKPSL